MPPTRFKRVKRPAIPAFFIESTAPNNLDDKDGAPGKTPEYCVKIPTPPEAIDRIAEELAKQGEPKLVITVHGFNSPRDAVLETYKKSFLAVNHAGRRREWERLGQVRLARHHGFCSGLFSYLLAPSIVLDLCGLGNSVRTPVTAVTAMMAVIPITLFLLRLIVYFRDVYIVRLIDARLDERQKDLGTEKRTCRLSATAWAALS